MLYEGPICCPKWLLTTLLVCRLTSSVERDFSRSLNASWKWPGTIETRLLAEYLLWHKLWRHWYWQRVMSTLTMLTLCLCECPTLTLWTSLTPQCVISSMMTLFMLRFSRWRTRWVPIVPSWNCPSIEENVWFLNLSFSPKKVRSSPRFSLLLLLLQAPVGAEHVVVVGEMLEKWDLTYT